MTSDEFSELLEAKGMTGVPSACPACGTSPWWGKLTDILDFPVRPPGRLTPDETASYLSVEVIAPTCGRCGYMMIFDRKLLIS